MVCSPRAVMAATLSIGNAYPTVTTDVSKSSEIRYLTYLAEPGNLRIGARARTRAVSGGIWSCGEVVSNLSALGVTLALIAGRHGVVRQRAARRALQPPWAQTASRCTRRRTSSVARTAEAISANTEADQDLGFTRQLSRRRAPGRHVRHQDPPRRVAVPARRPELRYHRDDQQHLQPDERLPAADRSDDQQRDPRARSTAMSRRTPRRATTSTRPTFRTRSSPVSATSRPTGFDPMTLPAVAAPARSPASRRTRSSTRRRTGSTRRCSSARATGNDGVQGWIRAARPDDHRQRHRYCALAGTDLQVKLAGQLPGQRTPQLHRHAARTTSAAPRAAQRSRSTRCDRAVGIDERHCAGSTAATRSGPTRPT